MRRGALQPLVLKMVGIGTGCVQPGSLVRQGSSYHSPLRVGRKCELDAARPAEVYGEPGLWEVRGVDWSERICRKQLKITGLCRQNPARHCKIRNFCRSIHRRQQPGGLDDCPLHSGSGGRKFSFKKQNSSTKQNVPRLVESWDACRTALPRSLLMNRLSIRARDGNGSDGLLRK